MTQPRPISGYFPLFSALTAAEQTQFLDELQLMRTNPNLSIRLFTVVVINQVKRLIDITATLNQQIGWIAAGHITEVFFYRQDLLKRVLEQKREIRLYTSKEALELDGGQDGGVYNPRLNAIQLVVSRMTEGFLENEPMPGVAPFLHEFGHLLDHTDSQIRGVPMSGLLPGWHPDYGEIQSADAFDAFRRGKEIELDRYHKRVKRSAAANDPPPIGSPYVFQNDTEFIAGYLEMFFRNPHYFAQLNPDLYDGFSKLLHQNPRQVWATDFPKYVKNNIARYADETKPLPAPGITIP